MYTLYEPRPEKICHRGLRPGLTHKTGCTGQPQKLAASQVQAWRSDMRLFSHLHDKRIKTTFYTDCKIYIEDGNFSGVLFLQNVYKIGGKSFLWGS